MTQTTPAPTWTTRRVTIAAVLIILVAAASTLVIPAPRDGSHASARAVAERFVQDAPHNEFCPWPDGEQLGTATQTPAAETTQILWQGNPANILVILIPAGHTWRVWDWQVDAGLGWTDCGAP